MLQAQARLLDSCLTKCLVDFWKICTTRRQLAPWQAGSQACLLPCTCHCPALSLKKCTKWCALSARQLVVPLSSFILPVEQGNRIFVAGKRDCQVFHCAAPSPLPSPCSVAVGARIMHEVVIIRANSIENFVPNVRFAGGSSTSLPLSPILFPSLSYSFYCSLSSSSLSPPPPFAPSLPALLILTKGKCATANEFGRN